MADRLARLITSAQRGDVEAQYQLASHYRQSQEEHAALLWAYVAHDNGHVQAHELAEAIIISDLLPEEDLAIAYLVLGCWYHLGKYVSQNSVKSAEYLALAKQINIPESFDLEELRERLDLPYLLDWDEIFQKR